jgi:hypothetical protein
MSEHSNKKNIDLKLKVWRQKNHIDKGGFVTYDAKQVSPDDSFLEMIDAVNEGPRHPRRRRIPLAAPRQPPGSRARAAATRKKRYSRSRLVTGAGLITAPVGFIEAPILQTASSETAP